MRYRTSLPRRTAKVWLSKSGGFSPRTCKWLLLIKLIFLEKTFTNIYLWIFTLSTTICHFCISASRRRITTLVLKKRYMFQPITRAGIKIFWAYFLSAAAISRYTNSSLGSSNSASLMLPSASKKLRNWLFLGNGWIVWSMGKVHY